MPSRIRVAREFADIFKLMSHPDRIRLVEELRSGESDVNTLAELLGLPAPRVSQHLSLLRAHRLVAEHRGGRHPDGLEALPHVREWLGYAKAAVDITRELGADLDDDARMKMLLEQNVILQLQHLKTHPAVATALARGALRLHGWVYDIRSGGVDAWNEETGRFESVADRYVAEVARHAAGSHGCAA